MADIYSTISLVAFILAGVSLLAAIVIFFALNIRGTYMELRGQTDKDWVAKQQKRHKATPIKGESKTVQGVIEKTVKIVEDEAVTVLDSGEEVTEVALVGVYEPGTDIADLADEEKTEAETVKKGSNGAFKVTRREIYIFSNEII